MSLVLRLARDTLAVPVIPVALSFAAAAVMRSATARRAVATLASAVGIVVAHLVNVGVPRLPPIDTIGWIPIATAIASLALFLDNRRSARLVITFAITSAAAWLIGRPAWTIYEGIPCALLAGSSASAIAGSLDIARRRMPPAAMLLAFAVATACASIACLRGHSALLAQVLGASAAVIGASGLAAIRVEPANTSATVAVVSAITVVVYARLYAGLPVRAILLLAAAASAPIIASSLPLQRHARSIASVILAFMLGGAAAIAV